MENTCVTVGLTIAMSCAILVPADAQQARLRLTVAGAALAQGRVESVVVDGDMARVDAATIVIEPGRGRAPAISDSVSVDAVGGGDGAPTIFKGEVVGIEPTYDASGKPTVTLRAFNRLHRLTRGTKSRSFEKISDADIARAIAKEAGLAFGPSGPEAGQAEDHVYQDNQTDLEFLRQRAARIGYEVFVDDTTLIFQRHADPASIALGCPQAPGVPPVGLRLFHVRLSSANQVSKVTVRGWDPKNHREIIGAAQRPLIRLSLAESTAPAPGLAVDLGFVQALEGDAAYGAALGTLSALTAQDLSAEGDADGSARLRAGAAVDINQAGDRFDGKYAVIGVSHRSSRLGQADGYHTLLRVVRADRAVFVLPQTGNDVLVAFEQGDIARPIVVGSLWNEKATVPEVTLCDPRRPRP